MDESLRHTRWLSDTLLTNMVEAKVSKVNYWRFIFASRHGSEPLWRIGLKALIARPMSDDEFRLELLYITPERAAALDSETALVLYRRSPALTRPFIQRFFREGSVRLFEAAQENGDEDFLDFLTYRMLTAVQQLVPRAIPPHDRFGSRPQPDQEAQRKIGELSRVVTTRFDQLYAKSPSLFVQRSAHVLNFVAFSDFRWLGAPGEHNPIWQALTGGHDDDWQRSPEAMTDLMESPNIYVQLSALDILSAGGSQAAARVLENLPAFRALLLADVRKATKRQALVCLERAAQADPETARRILPILQETMDFNAKRAAPDDIAMRYVRIQNAPTEG